MQISGRTLLDSEHQSPDPIFGMSGVWNIEGGMQEALITPAWIVDARPADSFVDAWSPDTCAELLPLSLGVPGDGLLRIVFDFGTELEGELEISVSSEESLNLFVRFGESYHEAAGRGVPGQHPSPVEFRHLESGKRQFLTFPSRGFRMVALEVFDRGHTLQLDAIRARARFFGTERKGSFHATDERLMRAWQTSLYTARLCTRQDCYWDGVKRDRHGWYGDARITQQTVDSVFHDPTPAMGMLLKFEDGAWANDIPGYSFDAIAMFRHLLLHHGLVDGADGLYRRIRSFLKWLQESQVNGEGFLIRREEVKLFFGIGFLDWSPMPVGGRLEELSWAQCRLLEGVRLARDVALLMEQREDAEEYHAWWCKLRQNIRERFWANGDFVHTLNRSREHCEMLLPDTHAVDTYEKKLRLGPSGATRHSSAWAVLGGVGFSEKQKDSLVQTLLNYEGPSTITPYFRYYEALAMAELGRPLEGIAYFSDYIIEQIERFDSATIWESYEPHIEDFRAWGLTSTWPKSLCHGWSSGLVPLWQRYISGLCPTGAGWSKIALYPSLSSPCDYESVVPTPRGEITISRLSDSLNVYYRIPESVACDSAGNDNIKIERY
ncbi:MAG: hypothetical protein ACOC2L_00240 [Candidatus Sumerlaeota bacterium]